MQAKILRKVSGFSRILFAKVFAKSGKKELTKGVVLKIVKVTFEMLRNTLKKT
jgi:hypothetical protein